VPSTTASIEPADESASSSMRPAAQRFGLSCAIVTPFTAQGAVDLPRLAVHARRCLAGGCTSFTLFGTTGEGASLGFGERAAMLDAAVTAGFDLGTEVLAGVASASVEDAAAQANQLFDAGGRGILLAPPFYFKDADDEGLFRWFASVLERCRGPRDVILYHIPAVTQVPLSSALVRRLEAAFPGVIAGIKDSSGDWRTAERFIAAHPDLHVLIGDERLLAQAMRRGASGAINGLSNFCAERLRRIVDDGREVPGIAELVGILVQYPVTPGVKALVAHRYGDDGFLATAPPLQPAGRAARAALGAALDRLLATG
jgi:4-hydroxy-tetrahydrodipicolinate synthase